MCKSYICIINVLVLPYMYVYYLCLTIGRPSVFLSQPPLYNVSLTETATITCFAIGYNVSYRWVIESGSFPSKVIVTNKNTLMIPNVTSSDKNTYTCVASTQIGCVSSSTTEVIVTGMLLFSYISW